MIAKSLVFVCAAMEIFGSARAIAESKASYEQESRITIAVDYELSSSSDTRMLIAIKVRNGNNQTFEAVNVSCLGYDDAQTVSAEGRTVISNLGSWSEKKAEIVADVHFGRPTKARCNVNKALIFN